MTEILRLIQWVEEYGIVDDIKDLLADYGYSETVDWVVDQGFDSSEAEAIVSHYTL